LSVKDDFFDLHFELSHEKRFQILVLLSKEDINISTLSMQLDTTHQECSRNISRLVKAGLVTRLVDGRYSLTSYGEIILRLSSGERFVSRYKDYFTNHDLSRIPYQFVSRIGDLLNSTYIDDAIVFFHSVATGIQEAEKNILVMVDQFVMSHVPIVKDTFKRKVVMKTIEPEVWVAPSNFYSVREEAEKTWAINARNANLLEHRVLEKIEVYIHMSEKEAALAFPTLNGRFDHLGFVTTDERALKWCRDLFYYYWEKTKPLIDPLRDFVSK
jgi:predicted transcriptional regulator